jgi:hypothetical protein
VLQQDGTWLVNIDGVFYSAQAQRTEMWADNREYYILESGDDSFAVPVDSSWPSTLLTANGSQFLYSLTRSILET